MAAKKSIFDSYGVDTKLEDGGVWVELALDSKIKIKVKSSENKGFQRALHAANMKHSKIIDKKKKTFEEHESINRTQHVTVIRKLLLDWEGFIGEDGKAIKFSVEKAEEILLKPSMRNLLIEIIEAATTEETFHSEEEIEAAEVIEGN